jgi:hypothetical protein
MIQILPKTGMRRQEIFLPKTHFPKFVDKTTPLFCESKKLYNKINMIEWRNVASLQVVDCKELFF